MATPNLQLHGRGSGSTHPPTLVCAVGGHAQRVATEAKAKATMANNAKQGGKSSP